MVRALTLLVLLAAPAAAHADTRPTGPGDDRGLLVSAALSAGAGGTGVAIGADAELGWGEGKGYSGGVTLRAQLRSAHASFDVTLSHDQLRWRDASTGARDRASFTRLGLGFSFY